MEPHMQYARSSDGVNIAYAVIGAGPPLVFAATIWGNLYMAQAGIDVVGFWSMDDLVATGRTIVLYDTRGAGSSDRDVANYSLEARVRDLEAVVGAAGIQRFPLIGFGHGAQTAIAYTVAHPEEVSDLILGNPFISGAEYYKAAPVLMALKAMQGMAAEEWEYLTRSLATGVLGFDDPAQSDKLARAFQKVMRPADLIGFREAAEAIDVGDLLPRVGVPTLVIRDDSIISPQLARAVATGIPGAHFTVTSDYVGTVTDFLGGPSTGVHSDLPSGTAIILFADIVDSTALTEQLGDATFRAQARALDVSLRALIRECAGTPVEGPTLGDGVLAVFTSAREAIEAALACARAGNDVGLPLHLGLHAGDVMREEDPAGRANVYGGAVNLASRISGLSAPGEVLVSRTVADLARTSAAVTFEDRGEHVLKGVGEPVRLCVVREGGDDGAAEVL
jgi:class 3 adenylate cyclase/alpha-beta hydrolase superfamily lysophospholipase